MERIAIVGSSGAGKSTLGRALRDITGLPLHYLDMVWHLPDGSHVAPERFDAEHAAIVAQPRWIIDGTYLRTLPERLERADTVFLLSLPTQECLDAVRSRIGGPREDLPWKRRSSTRSSSATSWSSGRRRSLWSARPSRGARQPASSSSSARAPR